MRYRLSHAAVALLLLAVPAAADDAAASAAQMTIERQLEAFLADDFATAYSYAAPNIKRIYPTQDMFMEMVQSGYRPVYRPQNYAFGTFEMLEDGRISQRVQILGPDGRNYEALYVLEKQADGVWRITGVSLRGSNALST